MTEIPVCDFCGDDEDVIVPEKAYVDGRTRFGSWAYQCEAHWAEYGGTGGMLGTGMGQRLVLREEG
jgi:hypothetical protein